MAVRAGHIRLVVRRLKPIVHMSATMTLKTKVLPGIGKDVAMWIVAGRAIEFAWMAFDRSWDSAKGQIVARRTGKAERDTHLVRMIDPFEGTFIGVATVADVR